MNTGDVGDNEEAGDGTDMVPAAGNSELLQILKIQQEQVKALHAKVSQMNNNIVTLTSKMLPNYRLISNSTVVYEWLV